MVAGAGVLLYWLWKKNNKGSEIAKENASTNAGAGAFDFYLRESKLKAECERSGGNWVQPHCIAPPCGGICAK